MKKIYGPNGARSGSKLPVALGGTDAASSRKAAENLGLVTSEAIRHAGGPVMLDQYGVLHPDQRPVGVNDPSVPSLNGPLSLYAGFTGTYTITNYDALTTYMVSATGGTVSIQGETITFVAGMVVGAASIAINGATFALQILAIPVAAPIVSSPANNATGLLDKVNVVASAFSSNPVDAHAASDWQVATDVVFTAIVKQSLNDSVNKTSWQVTGLSPNTDYYLRVRYKGATYGWSQWSTAVKFSTVLRFVPATPTITSPTDTTANLGTSFTITSGPFATLTGDTHAASDWQVATDAGFTSIAAQSLNDAVNKTSWTAVGLLLNQVYYLRVRYRGQNYGYGDWSPTVTVATNGALLLLSTVAGGGAGGEGSQTSTGIGDDVGNISGYGGYAAATQRQTLAVFGGDTFAVTIGQGGQGGYPTLYPNPGSGDENFPSYDSAPYLHGPFTFATAGGATVVNRNGSAWHTGPGGASPPRAYTFPTDGRKGQSSDFGSGGIEGNKYTPNARSNGGTAAGGGSAACWPRGSGYSIGGYGEGSGSSGGSGIAILEYDASFPKATNFTNATYSLVNGKHRFTFLTNGTLTIPAFAPTAPSITSPTDGALNLLATVNVAANAFSSPAADTHASSDWQVATDAAFTSIAIQSLNDAISKTSWAATGLSPNTTYYARVRYRGTAFGYSNWSTAVKFSTAASFVPATPSITSPANGATNQGSTVNLTASAFNSPIGSSHVSTDWQVATDAAFTNIFKQNLANTINKTSWSVAGLSPNTTYYVRVRYTDAANGTSAYSATSSFKTLVSFVPNTPSVSNTSTLTYATSDGNPTAGTMVVQASGFSSPNPAAVLTQAHWRVGWTYFTDYYTSGTTFSYVVTGSGSDQVQVRYTDNFGYTSPWSNYATATWTEFQDAAGGAG